MRSRDERDATQGVRAGLRLTPEMVAADPMLIEDPVELYHELLEAYHDDDVYDLWAIARALRTTLPLQRSKLLKGHDEAADRGVDPTGEGSE